MENQAVAVVNLGMLKKAESAGGTTSVMNKIGQLKIYNPKPGDEADPAFANTFLYRPAGAQEFSPVEGPLAFNPLSVTLFYSGEVYPIDEDGNTADEKVFFSTSEFGKYTKKTETIGLAAGNKPVGFFTKEGFESMIKVPRLNGGTNQFYERKKDSTGKPYDSSYLSKRYCVYGKFVAGPNAGEYFRYIMSSNAFGVTFKDGEVCLPEEGTLEAAVNSAVDDMNALLSANGMRTVKRVEPDQIDVGLEIVTNARGNFLPKFSYEGLVANRGYDNEEDCFFIHNLKQEHFASVFVGMDVPTPVSVDKGNALVALAQPQQKAQPRIQASNDTVPPPWEEAKTFDDPTNLVAEADAVFGNGALDL